MRLNLGFASLLTLLFMIAKLLGVVTWSWWLVFCPILISLAVVSFLILVALVIVVMGAVAVDRIGRQ